MAKTHEEFSSAGFKFFPTTQDSPTYRNALVSSTIDFLYYRQVEVTEAEVSRVFIALHKPLSALFKLPSQTSSSETKLEPAYG
jgi:endonuclease/exonuclease/phosphatase (EEP) superfamily protein YafD